MSEFFQTLAHCLTRERIAQPEVNHFIGKQAQGPAFASFRRCRASDGDQARLGCGIKLPFLSKAWAFGQTSEVLLDEAFVCALDCRETRADFSGNLVITQALSSLAV